MCETMLKGWKRYRVYPDPRVLERFEREIVKLRSGYNAALWAMEHQFRSINSSVSEQIQSLRKKVEKEFGVSAPQVTYPRPDHAMDGAPRRTPPGRRQDLRTANVRTNWASTWGRLLPHPDESPTRMRHVLATLLRISR